MRSSLVVCASAAALCVFLCAVGLVWWRVATTAAQGEVYTYIAVVVLVAGTVLLVRVAMTCTEEEDAVALSDGVETGIQRALLGRFADGVDDGQECPICLDRIAVGELFLTPCGHAFHHACLTKWTHDHGNTTCPECRYSVVVTIVAPDG